MKQILTCTIFLGLASSIGSASVVYDNGGPNQISADNLSDTLIANDFTLLTATTLTGFEFWNVELAGQYNGSITWFIFSNLAGIPGSTILAQGSASSAGQITRTATGLTSVFISGDVEFDNVVNLSTSLTSGSLAFITGTYWLGLHNGPIGSTSFLDFYWETAANNGTNFGYGQELAAGLPWITPVSTLQESAFKISDNVAAIPEPGTWALMSAGLVALASIRGKRANQ